MFTSRFGTATVSCLLPLALSACGHPPPADPRTEPPLVRVATVARGNAASRAFTGTVAARVQSDLGFRVPGKVLARLVDTGQTVKRGQLLFRLDPADLELSARAQRETVAAARARAHQTADDETRYRDLPQTGAVSASAYDQVRAAAEAARALLRAAEAQAEVAGNSTRYAELTADADGVVVETLAEPGQVVSVGQAVVRIAHAGRREAVIQVPETLRPALGSPGRASLFGREGESVATRLRQLSDAADSLTRTFEARYVLEGALANAPLGTTVTIEITTGASEASADLQVPIGALYDAGKGPGVWVITGEPATVSWRRVVIHQIEDERARIGGGAKPGDRIVALGAHLLREGQKVRVASTSAKAATGELL
jgi:RND family efflux transporter MFP subunit